MSIYKIVSWNVNSVRARLEAVAVWLKEYQPNVLALQETKVEDVHFPVAFFEELGYHVTFHGQKSYNGVAILSKEPPTDVVFNGQPQGSPPRASSQSVESADAEINVLDKEARILAVTFGKLRVVNIYVPNGQDLTSEKYSYKLSWLEQFRQYIAEELVRYPNMVILGDFNIAPEDADVYDPKIWQDRVLVSQKERFALEKLLRLGLKDSFRLFDQPKDHYSWWDYRAASFRRNMGLRIDLILIGHALVKQCVKSDIDKTPRGWDKPSDHAPVWINLLLDGNE